MSSIIDHVTISATKTSPGDSYICRYKEFVVFLECASIASPEKYNVKDKNDVTLGTIEYTDGQVCLSVENPPDKPTMVYRIFQDPSHSTEWFIDDVARYSCFREIIIVLYNHVWSKFQNDFGKYLQSEFGSID